MNSTIKCPNCGGVMLKWRLIGSGEDQVWESINYYYCESCGFTSPPEPVAESDTKGDLNTDGFVM